MYSATKNFHDFLNTPDSEGKTLKGNLAAGLLGGTLGMSVLALVLMTQPQLSPDLGQFDKFMYALSNKGPIFVQLGLK